MKRLLVLAIVLCVVLSSLGVVAVSADKGSTLAHDPIKDLKLSSCGNAVCFADIEPGKTPWTDVIPTLQRYTDIEISSQDVQVVSGVYQDTAEFSGIYVTLQSNESSGTVDFIQFALQPDWNLPLGTFMSIFGQPSCGEVYDTYNSKVELYYVNDLIVVVQYEQNNFTESRLDLSTSIDELLINKKQCKDVSLFPWQGFSSFSRRGYLSGLHKLS